MTRNILRTCLERLSRGVVLNRVLPSQYGGARIFVTPDSALKFWRPDLAKVDPNLLEAAAELVRPGDCVWDIGANVGLFAFSAAGLAGRKGRVLAIEPDAWLATLLHKSAACAPATSAPVQVLPIAVSDTMQIAHLKIAARGRSSNALGSGYSPAGGARGRDQSTMCVTLDWLLEVCDPPTVLKIDVEGLETQVLKGAHKLLSTARPRILCEVSADNTKDFADFLRPYGYSLFDADAPKSARQELAVASWNTIAYPLPT
jgi:FkbM family methyltransferase